MTYIAKPFDASVRVLDHPCGRIEAQPKCVEGHGFEPCDGKLDGYDIDCTGCGHLLGYDPEEGRYVCVSCGAVYHLRCHFTSQTLCGVWTDEEHDADGEFRDDCDDDEEHVDG